MTGPSEIPGCPAPSQEPPTRTDLAQLVRWMLDSGLYDTEDAVGEVALPNVVLQSFEPEPVPDYVSLLCSK